MVDRVRFEHHREPLGIGEPRAPDQLDGARPTGTAGGSGHTRSLIDGRRRPDRMARPAAGSLSRGVGAGAVAGRHRCRPATGAAVAVRVWGEGDDTPASGALKRPSRPGCCEPADWTARVDQPGLGAGHRCRPAAGAVPRASSPWTPSPSRPGSTSPRTASSRPRSTADRRRRGRARPGMEQLPAPAALSHLRRHRSARRRRERDRRDGRRRLVPRAHRLRRRPAKRLRRPARRCWPSSRSGTPTGACRQSAPTSSGAPATARSARAGSIPGETYDARARAAGLDSPPGSTTGRLVGGTRPSRHRAPWSHRRAAGPPDRGDRARSRSSARRPGATIVDFGQNLVGTAADSRSAATAGQTITLRHAEVLEHGELGHPPAAEPKPPTSTRSAATGSRTWEPRFTFHGFRYAEIDGWPGELHAGRPARGGPAHRHGAHRLVLLLGRAAQPAARERGLGDARATSSTCRPIARSGTSGWAGPATSRSSPRPPVSCTTAPACSAPGWPTWPPSRSSSAPCRSTCRSSSWPFRPRRWQPGATPR